MGDTRCPAESDLCAIYKGNALPFDFTFLDPDDNPIDISNMRLYFTMMSDPELPELQATDIQHYVDFPAGGDSLLGIGSMKVPATKTDTLLPNTSYHFDFLLVDDPNTPVDIFTMGSGEVHVRVNVTKLSMIVP